MPFFRKKPVVIEAVQLTDKSIVEVFEFIHGHKPDLNGMITSEKWSEYEDIVRRDGYKINTLEGVMTAQIGDWIIKGVESEFYPCKPDIFQKTYEEAVIPLTHSGTGMFPFLSK